MHIYEKDGKKLPSVTTIIHSLGNEEIINIDCAYRLAQIIIKGHIC